MDAGHHLLAEIAPFRIAHRLLGAGLLREVIWPKVTPKGHAAEVLEAIREADKPTSAKAATK